jgi:hypothetical protein
MLLIKVSKDFKAHREDRVSKDILDKIQPHRVSRDIREHRVSKAD